MVRARGRNLTLEEIGQRAGVSRSTVSRVLNDHPDVRPAVRERVEAVIQETGYQPNQAARALVSSRTGLIGLVMLTEIDELFGDPYYSALVHGIRQGCVEHDLIFSIFPVYGPDGPDALTPQIAHGFVDGVIVTAGPGRDRFISSLHRRNKPMVVVGHPAEEVAVMRVDVDQRGGATDAVVHLIGHGRQRVGFVGPTPDYLFGVERLDGYRDAFEAAGREVDPTLIQFGQPSTDGGYRATQALLADQPDAIFVATDPMAIGAYRAVAEHGLRIPDDVAIVGFDGLPGEPVLDPPLTTVVQPVHEVGRTAVALLARADEEPETVILPTTLRTGRSCGVEHSTPSAV